MKTTEIKIPDFLELEIRKFISDKLEQRKQEIEQEIAFINSFKTSKAVKQELPFTEGEKEEIPPAEAKVSVQTTIKRKRNPNKGPKRQNLLGNITVTLTKSPIPLTTHEIVNTVRPFYPTKNLKEDKRLYSSVSAILAQYHLHYDRRFDRTKDDNKNFIYMMRNNSTRASV